MIETYRSAGFAHLHAALDPALVARWRAPLLEAAQRLPNNAKNGEIAAVFQPGLADAIVANILGSGQLGQIAAALLGIKAIRLIAAAAYIKPAGAPATFWHQDLWFFPVVGVPMTTLWVPLTPVEEACAPLVYAAGSHLGGFANWREETPPDTWPLHRIAPVAVGDVLVHDGWMLHGSEANIAAQPREALGLSYVPADTRFATCAELRREPERWAWLAAYLDQADYREGASIEGAACPVIALS